MVFKQSQGEIEKWNLEPGVPDSIQYAFLGHNYQEIVKQQSIFGDPTLWLDALKDKNLGKTYWLLDGNAFDDQPGPPFMKLDTLILGGCPLCLVLPKEDCNPVLVNELEVNGSSHVPIGFIDMHKVSDTTFSVSGLGVSKPYQGMGLSKYLIYGGVVTTGAKELIIPTQLSNTPAHKAWKHLGPLEILCDDPFHNEEDTIVYKGKVPKEPWKILYSQRKFQEYCDKYNAKSEGILVKSDCKEVI